MWQPLGSGLDGNAIGLTVAGADVIAAGSFSFAGGNPANRVASWGGTTWQPLGSGTNGNVYEAATTATGDPVIAGGFTTAGSNTVNHIARWDGSSWHPLGAGVDGNVESLTQLANGDLIVGGTLANAGGIPSPNVARWNGSKWSAVGDGVDDAVMTLASRYDGTIVIGGNFTASGDVAAPYIASLEPGCPPTSTVLPTSCIGPNGPMTMTATAAWAGSTYRATCTGYGASSIAVSAIGFGPASMPLPLGLVFPTALPGCSLLAPTQVIDVSLPVAGIASYALPLPNVPTLTGAQLTQQFTQLELGASGFASVSVSNGITFSIGSY
ncbi:MAG: hypothetical protein ACE37K_16370 [Planctomycetota bacterium]